MTTHSYMNGKGEYPIPSDPQKQDALLPVLDSDLPAATNETLPEPGPGNGPGAGNIVTALGGIAAAVGTGTATGGFMHAAIHRRQIAAKDAEVDHIVADINTYGADVLVTKETSIVRGRTAYHLWGQNKTLLQKAQETAKNAYAVTHPALASTDTFGEVGVSLVTAGVAGLAVSYAIKRGIQKLTA